VSYVESFGEKITKNATKPLAVKMLEKDHATWELKSQERGRGYRAAVLFNY
jgi:hypothetical protein